MNPRHVAAFAIVFLSSACATTSSRSDVIRGWVGVPESRLLTSWGVPDRTATLSDGGKVDTWLTDWKDKEGMHTCRKSFTVDSEGNVVQQSWFDCPVHNVASSLITA